MKKLIENGTINGGMIPKVETCVDAVKNGVNANALNTQDVTDMGEGPIFYTVLAQIKRV